jgi:hypothetical protein
LSGPSKGLCAVLVAAALSCAPKAPETWRPLTAARGAFSASVACTLLLGDREFRASGGCAADPAQGARVELRDPVGATRLLILVTPARATLFSPQRGLAFTWTEAGREMPWSPRDLMALFAGPPPGSVKLSSGGPSMGFRWRNPAGRVSGEFTPADGPSPFSEARLKGPGRAALALRLDSARPQTFGPEIFGLPRDVPAAPASPRQILEEVTP